MSGRIWAIITTLGDKMKISIIVPIYKVEKYIRQCVDSIISQIYSELEIILVDDGSPDSCPEICDEYAENDKRIIVIHQQNKGLIEARKSGLRAATGEYVCFVDGDDWIEPDMYEKIANAIKKYTPDCVITQFYYSYPEREELSSYNLSREYYSRNDLEKEVFPTMLFKDRFYQFGIYPCCWTKVFKREILENHLFGVDSRIRMGEDAAFTYPCLMACNDLAFIDIPLYHYRQNPLSMTASYDDGLPETYLLAYLSVKNASVKCGVDLSGQLPYYCLYLTNFALRNEISASNQKNSDEKNFVIKQLVKNSYLEEEMHCISLKLLPFHTKILATMIRIGNINLVKIYLHLLKLSF